MLNQSTPKLTSGALMAYDAVFETTHSEFLKMQNIRAQLDRLTVVKWENPNPKFSDSVTTSDGQKWNVYALANLPKQKIIWRTGTG